MNKERIARRVHGRKQAEAIISLLDLPHIDCVEAFIDELRSKLCPAVVETEKKLEERSIRELSYYKLDFGQHAGKQLDEIPRDYLYWLLDSSTETMSRVLAYLEATKQQDEEKEEDAE